MSQASTHPPAAPGRPLTLAPGLPACTLSYTRTARTHCRPPPLPAQPQPQAPHPAHRPLPPHTSPTHRRPPPQPLQSADSFLTLSNSSVSGQLEARTNTMAAGTIMVAAIDCLLVLALGLVPSESPKAVEHDDHQKPGSEVAKTMAV